MWYESEKPEAEEIPCHYSSTLDGFRKLLLIRSWSPDRTISQAKRYIEGFSIFFNLLNLFRIFSRSFITFSLFRVQREHSIF